jgi:hypothetical protein
MLHPSLHGSGSLISIPRRLAIIIILARLERL